MGNAIPAALMLREQVNSSMSSRLGCSDLVEQVWLGAYDPVIRGLEAEPAT